ICARKISSGRVRQVRYRRPWPGTLAASRLSASTAFHRTAGKAPVNGSTGAFTEAGSLRSGNLAFRGNAARLLAFTNQMAREVLAGKCRGPSAGAASNRAWILFVGGHGCERATRKTVAGVVRAYAGFYLRGSGPGVGTLQPPFRGAAAGRR